MRLMGSEDRFLYKDSDDEEEKEKTLMVMTI